MVYAIGVYISDKVQKSWYLDDYKNAEEMMKGAYEFIIENKIKRVYAHNLSGFDGILIVNLSKGIAEEMGLEVTANVKGSTIPHIKVKCKKNIIVFKDSLNLLNKSLAELCKAYGIEEKGKFPHLFMERATISWEGAKPAKEMYANITDEQYESIPKVVKIKEMAIDYMM